jgi:hypothetical protein
MATNLDLKILRAEDIETVLAFEKQRLALETGDEMEREFAAWSAPWRPEALNHYLKNGWSLGAFAGAGDGQTLAGYLLAQPLLFFRGLTQTLWVERVAYESPNIGEALIEASWRWAKDKHLQKMILGGQEIDFDLGQGLGAKIEEQRWLAVATSRIKS